MTHIDAETMDADGMIAYLTRRGYRAEPVVNDLEVGCDPARPARTVGYTLRGPRGSKTFVSLDAAGLVSGETVRLWCDGVAYSSQSITSRKPSGQPVSPDRQRHGGSNGPAVKTVVISVL